MKEYIITVALAAVIASVVDILAPKEWEKYIKIIIGFLILSVIIAPIVKFRDVKILSPTKSYDISDEPLRDSVSEALRQNIEFDIKERILEEFGENAEVVVEIDVDEDKAIRGVRGIKLKMLRNPEGMIARLEEIYGCDRIEFYYD